MHNLIPGDRKRVLRNSFLMSPPVCFHHTTRDFSPRPHLLSSNLLLNFSIPFELSQSTFQNVIKQTTSSSLVSLYPGYTRFESRLEDLLCRFQVLRGLRKFIQTNVWLVPSNWLRSTLSESPAAIFHYYLHTSLDAVWHLQLTTTSQPTEAGKLDF
jgi:hypothetical protein